MYIPKDEIEDDDNLSGDHVIINKTTINNQGIPSSIRNGGAGGCFKRALHLTGNHALARKVKSDMITLTQVINAVISYNIPFVYNGY